MAINKNLSLGLDIGTTTISASVVDTRTQKQVRAYTIANQTFVTTDEPFKKEQDAQMIFDKIEALLAEILNEYDEIGQIGITGQMHGILYLNECGEAVSNLLTWQDKRSGLATKSGSYIDEIYCKTGKTIAVGYGLATHYYNLKNGLVPITARKLCTVMDYIAMRLCGEKEPKIHPTNGAGLGLFDLNKNDFDFEAIKKLGIDERILPTVVDTNYKIGTYNKIPVFVGIGDNQASFFGTVANEQTSVLVNYGTGSQISFVGQTIDDLDGFEIRPYRDGEYLYSGAAICGGRAYAILEKFFSDYLSACGISNGKQYDVMRALAKKGYENESGLVMETTFCGTRQNPDKTGGLYNITEENFTPENIVYATLKGMATELFDLFSRADKKRFKNLIASGNAVRLNPVFQSILSRVFEMPLSMPTVSEEAAYGVALWINTSSKKRGEKRVKTGIEYVWGEKA